MCAELYDMVAAVLQLRACFLAGYAAANKGDRDSMDLGSPKAALPDKPAGEAIQYRP